MSTTTIELLVDGRVRTLTLEGYMRGVGEVPALWPMEVVKAQVVAARSFAAASIDAPRHTGQGAHLCSSPRCCQGWGPGTHPRRDQAIEETRSLVLWYVGPDVVLRRRAPFVVKTFYHARCGGHTGRWLADKEIWHPAWNPEAAPWMHAVPCPCPEMPGWSGEVTRRGHGFGLCQWGARVLADRGYSFREILMHYYTDVALSLLSEGPQRKNGGDRCCQRLTGRGSGSDALPGCASSC